MITIGVGETCNSKTDPINILFRGSIDLNIVNAVFQSLGWIRLYPVFGNLNVGSGVHCAVTHVLCSSNGLEPEPQDSQYVDGRMWDRIHVRLWDMHRLVQQHGSIYPVVLQSAAVVGAAHHEVADLLLRHRVTSHEDGKIEAEVIFSGQGWVVDHDSEFTGNQETRPFCNDYASVITRV